MKQLSNSTPGPGLTGSPERGGGEAVLLEYSGCTDAGKARPNNEDALLAGTGRDGRLFAAGMGGHEAGDLFLAVATLERLWPDDPLVEAIRLADRTIFACRDDGEFAGMGTTVVALRFRENGFREGDAEYGLEAEDRPCRRLEGLPPARRAALPAHRRPLGRGRARKERSHGLHPGRNRERADPVFGYRHDVGRAYNVRGMARGPHPPLLRRGRRGRDRPRAGEVPGGSREGSPRSGRRRAEGRWA